MPHCDNCKKTLVRVAVEFLDSILISVIVYKKRQYLVDLTYISTNLCFMGGLLAAMYTCRCRIIRTRKLHEKLGGQIRSKQDREVFEQHLQVNIQLILYEE